MWTVLCHETDTSAVSTFDALRRHRKDVELVTVEDLASPFTVWEHRVSTADTVVRVQLPDGRVVGDGVDAVLNRMISPPLGVLAAAPGNDNAYAHSEVGAFTISWINALAPVVVNGASVQGYSGPWRSAFHWRALAARAGLPIVPYLRSSNASEPAADTAQQPSTTVLCVGGRLLDESAPDHIRSAATRLAAHAETAVLGLCFAGGDPETEGWRVLDATPHPDLCSAGEAGVEALVEVLSR